MGVDNGVHSRGLDTDLPACTMSSIVGLSRKPLPVPGDSLGQCQPWAGLRFPRFLSADWSHQNHNSQRFKLILPSCQSISEPPRSHLTAQTTGPDLITPPAQGSPLWSFPDTTRVPIHPVVQRLLVAWPPRRGHTFYYSNNGEFWREKHSNRKRSF